jgi:hypothetical protein
LLLVSIYSLPISITGLIVIYRNDGTFCPNGYACVYCKGSSTQICCQGSGGAQIPVYQTNIPTEGTARIPDPTTAVVSTVSEPQASITATEPKTTAGTKSVTQVTNVGSAQYWTTTWYYSYIVWTHIQYILSTVEFTTTTTSTVLSCTATDRIAASSTLSSLGRAVQSSASSSAAAASPLNTGGTTVRVTATATAKSSADGRPEAGLMLSILAFTMTMLVLY